MVTRRNHFFRFFGDALTRIRRVAHKFMGSPDLIDAPSRVFALVVITNQCNKHLLVGIIAIWSSSVAETRVKNAMKTLEWLR